MHLIKTKDQTCLFVSLAATLVGPHQLQRLTEALVETGTKETEKLATNVSGYIQDTFTQLGNASRQTGMTLPTGNGTTFAPNNCTSPIPIDDDSWEFAVGGILLAVIILVLLIGGGYSVVKGRHRQEDQELRHYTRLP
ncbi:MAG: hypothetical protein KVP17_004588 [Porospora cf. gigantea B]|uniref:uncharacterized protein n=1 Tax=Porospora cf. gigantea B TaxID=2853592 RepID=UPI003571AD61|nr:MAG: hypothetical protein KVP17_004588 [Porospora cf. gigantea B]